MILRGMIGRSRVLVLVAALCSVVAAQTSAGTRSPGDVLATATMKTSRAKSSEVALDGRVTVNGQSAWLHGSGVLAGRSAHMTVEMRGVGPTLKLEMIMVAERGTPVMYMASDLFAAQLPAGKRWIRIDLEREGKALGLDVDSLFGASTSNQSAVFRHASVTTRVGTESVMGGTMTRYHSVVDFDSAAAANPRLADTIERLRDLSGMDRATTESWVDAGGFLRRTRTAYDVRDGSGALRHTTTTVSYLSFGGAVRISAPLRGEVVEAASLPGW